MAWGRRPEAILAKRFRRRTCRGAVKPLAVNCAHPLGNVYQTMRHLMGAGPSGAGARSRASKASLARRVRAAVAATTPPEPRPPALQRS
eukprot:2374115-Prymnesium_polylepis.1